MLKAVFASILKYNAPKTVRVDASIVIHGASIIIHGASIVIHDASIIIHDASIVILCASVTIFGVICPIFGENGERKWIFVKFVGEWIKNKLNNYRLIIFKEWVIITIFSRK